MLLGSGSWRGGILVWWCWAFEGEVEGSAGDGADDFGTGGVVCGVHFWVVWEFVWVWKCPFVVEARQQLPQLSRHHSDWVK